MSSEVKQETNSTPPDVKKDSVDEALKDTKDSKLKDGDKDKVKKETKKEVISKSSEEEDEEEEDDEDDDDDEVALLDRPVVMTGCRARKKVERLEISFSTPKEKQEFSEGKGKKLGDCPRIEAQIQKMKVIDLKPLHKILFNRIGSGNEIKKNIRKFSGFPFDTDSTEYKRKKASLDKSTLQHLKQVCSVLDLERSGTKDEIVTRIMTFLMNPEDSGKKVPTSKKKASKEKKKSVSKKVKSEKKKVEKNKTSEEEKGKSEEEEDEEEDEENNSSGGESSMGGTDEDIEVDEASDEGEASDEEPKKKSKDAKTPKAKSKADKGKKDEKKTKGTKRKQGDGDVSESSADDVPPPKKSKMPTNEEISKLVKHILDSADLQEITMKKVIKQVSDAYPDFDLTHKKAFIKSTIKSVIS